jgi:hypothetical protein
MARVAETPLSANEKLLLRLLLVNPDAPGALIPELKEVAAIREMRTYRIFEAVFAQYEAGALVRFNEIYDRLDEENRAILSAAVLLQETDETEASVDQGIACLHSLQSADIESRRTGLKARIREMERAGNIAEALRLSQELDRIKRFDWLDK